MKRLLLVVSIAVGMNASVALAEPEKNQGMTPSKMTSELRKQMADMYQKMADCLRTDKSLEQCSRDAMKNCPVVEQTGHCPISEGVGPMMAKGTKHPMGSMGHMQSDHSMNGGK